MAKSSNTGEPKAAKSSTSAEPKARRTPARRRTDKAVPAASAHAAEMATAMAPGLPAGPPSTDLSSVGSVAMMDEMSARALGMEPRVAGPSPEEVERRAYEIYLQRGGQDGRDLEDWLEAERQLRGQPA